VSDVRDKVEEELRKEGLGEVEVKGGEEGKEQPKPSRERIEAKAVLTKSRLASDIEREVEEVERMAEERSRSLEQYYQMLPEEGGDRLLTPQLLGGGSNKELYSLLERIVKGDESGDPMKLILMLYILKDLEDREFWKRMMMTEWFEERRLRRQQMWAQQYAQPSQDKLVEAINKLDEQIRSFIAEVKNTVASAKTPEERLTVKEVLDAAKELVELSKGSNNVEPNVLEKISEGFKALAEALKELRSGKGSPEDVMETVDRTLKMVRNVVEAARSLVPQPPQQTVSYSPVTTTTMSPLNYSGAAPWWFHPDARNAIKDLLDSLAKSIANAYIAVKSAGRAPIASESKPYRPPELPEGLRL